MTDPFIGEIRMFAGTFVPRGYAYCDGGTLAIDQNEMLFAIIGTTYGGNGRTTVGLPDMEGRVPVHAGTGSGLINRRMGEKGGAATVTVTTNNMPSHNHTLRAFNADGNQRSPGGNAIADARFHTNTSVNMVNMAGGAISSTGGGQAVDTLMPYLAISFIIATTGGFPAQG